MLDIVKFRAISQNLVFPRRSQFMSRQGAAPATDALRPVTNFRPHNLTLSLPKTI
jgi:hypothetical protein